MQKNASWSEVYASTKLPDRDEQISDKIAIYFKDNISSITDGIINKVPKITAPMRQTITTPYNIGAVEWKMIQSNPAFKNIKKLGSPLNIGLLMSYYDTKNRAFLVYLFILMYSSVYAKYFTKGTHNAMVMRYTIDNSDNRTDFKRYQCSLIAVVNKKVDAFISNYSRILSSSKPPSDANIVELLQGSKTRMNEMLKSLYGKYKENMASPEVKIMMQYTETAEGKHVLSMQNVFDKLKDSSAESLFSPSDIILNRCGLVANNPETTKYRNVIVAGFNENFSILSKANTLIIDKWMLANANRLTSENFKKTFVASMLNGRNISHIYQVIDVYAEKVINKYGAGSTFNKLTLRTYIYRYIVLNIYMSALRIF